jgi:hypothetical protein
MAMVSVLISELSWEALDYAVARCEGFSGWEPVYRDGRYFDGHFARQRGLLSGRSLATLGFSYNWALAGPIIEREQIDLLHRDMQWAAIDTMEEHQVEGRTPLVAAMRCYVASKTEGDSVMIPEELI